MSNWGLKVSGVLLAGLLGGVLFHAHSQASGASSDPWLDAVKASVGVGDFRISRKAPLADGPLMDMTPLKVDLNTLRGSGLTQVIQMLGDTKRRIVLKPAPSPAESGKVQAATWDDAKKEVVVEVYGRFVDERTVPGVNTLQAKEAFRKIQDAGLLPKAERGPSAPSALEAYTVKEVIPPAGSIVAKDSEVRVILYGKPETVKRVVPNLRNLTVDEAKKQLPAGLQLRETVGKEAASKSQANTIYEQDPVPGVEVLQGAHVNVTRYGNYQLPASPPSGSPVETARLKVGDTFDCGSSDLARFGFQIADNSRIVKVSGAAPGLLSVMCRYRTVTPLISWVDAFADAGATTKLKNQLCAVNGTESFNFKLSLPNGMSFENSRINSSNHRASYVQISHPVQKQDIDAVRRLSKALLKRVEPFAAICPDAKSGVSEGKPQPNPRRNVRPFDSEIPSLPGAPGGTIFGQ